MGRQSPSTYPVWLRQVYNSSKFSREYLRKITYHPSNHIKSPQRIVWKGIAVSSSLVISSAVINRNQFYSLQGGAPGVTYLSIGVIIYQGGSSVRHPKGARSIGIGHPRSGDRCTQRPVLPPRPLAGRRAEILFPVTPLGCRTD